MTIFSNPIDPNLGKSVQWVFIKAVDVQHGRLIVTSEGGKTYHVDVNTKAITQPDSRSSPSPGAIRKVPDTVKKPLTNGSTGKLGIAIVHGATGEVTIFGAGIAIGNGGDDFEWMDS